MPHLKDWEKLDQPHCVYRLYTADDVPLYIGCSIKPFARQEQLSRQAWYASVATVRLTWHPTWHHGRVAEMEAINAERPLHNTLVHDPANVGLNTAFVRTDGTRKRGDGKHCPKCGAEKEDRKKPYCKTCTSVYQAERRRIAQESLARTLAKV